MTEADIPRKLTVEETLTNSFLNDLAQRLVIRLDGKPQDTVVRYDMDGGEIERYVKDENDRLVVENDKAKREVVRGKVEVTLKP